MSAKRMFYLMVGAVVLFGMGLIASAYGANLMLKKQSQTLVALKARSQTITTQQTELAKAKKDIETYSGLNTIAKTVVPQDKDQAEAVREIVKIAADNGVRVGGVTFAASTLGAGGGTSGATAKKSPLTQVQPVPHISGVFQLPITVQQDPAQPITYQQFIDFLTALENNRRTAQVSTINIQPTTDRNKLTFTLQLNEYLKP